MKTLQVSFIGQVVNYGKVVHTVEETLTLKCVSMYCGPIQDAVERHYGYTFANFDVLTVEDVTPRLVNPRYLTDEDALIWARYIQANAKAAVDYFLSDSRDGLLMLGLAESEKAVRELHAALDNE